MTEYWLISAPGDKSCQQTWETMNNLTSKQNSLCVNYKFHIPDLKVGTLDQLVGLSDDLGKLDSYVEQVTRKVANYLGEVLEDQRDKIHENLTANNSQTSMDDEGANAEGGGLDTPPNTPVTPSHKTSREYHHHHHHHLHHHHQCHQHHNVHRHHRPWRDSGKCREAAETLATATTSCLGQHQNQQHRHNHHSRHHHYDNPDCNKKSLSSSQDESPSIYSCYHAHWCAASTPSTPSPTLSPNPATSPAASSCASSHCSSDEDDRWRRHKRTSSTRSISDDCNLDDVNFEDKDHDDQDFSGRLPNPGDLPSYITRFQWDMAKYPIKQSLRNIADIISKQIGQVDADLKTRSTTYNNLKGSLQNLEKKQTGSLLTRNLADLVKKEHFILDSEYLTTLLVIVPKSSFQEWRTVYEKLTNMIVPRSSQLITEDQEYGLFTVTLFKKVIEEFKLHAREKKFIVRDFTYNEEELAAGKNEMMKLATDKKKHFGSLVRWLKVNFSECFCAWIHVKALRVFVESVLRYGLPVNFQAILIHPNKKSTKRLRDLLNQLYAHLDSSATSSGQSANQDSIDIPGLGFGQSDYYPYVYYKINLDMVDNKV